MSSDVACCCIYDVMVTPPPHSKYISTTDLDFIITTGLLLKDKRIFYAHTRIPKRGRWQHYHHFSIDTLVVPAKTTN